jgi:hypothetical protein
MLVNRHLNVVDCLDSDSAVVADFVWAAVVVEAAAEAFGKVVSGCCSANSLVDSVAGSAEDFDFVGDSELEIVAFPQKNWNDVFDLSAEELAKDLLRKELRLPVGYN